jgi:hypothetical protein
MNGTIKLTIDHTKIDEILYDFPVWLFLENPNVFTALRNNYRKISVSTDSGERCYVEVSFWDNANNVASLFTKVPVVSNLVDTILYLDFDSTWSDNTTYVGATGSVAAQNVWDDNFVAVWHMVESGSGVTGEYKDSTGNGHHGTGGNGTASRTPTRVINEMGLPIQSFAGNGSTRSSYIQINDADDLSIPVPGGFTVEAVISPHQTNFRTNWIENLSVNYTPWIVKANPSGNKEWQFVMYDASGAGNEPSRINWTTWYNSSPTASYSNGATTFGPVILLDTYVYLAGTTICTDANHGTQHVYRNGVQSSSTALWETGNGGAVVNYTPGPAPVKIGCWDVGNGGFWFPGRISEIRISKIDRSLAWLKATAYSSQDNLIHFELLSGFPSGTIKTANLQVAVNPAALAYQIELWLGPNDTTKSATSGKVSFTSTGATQSLSVPITMPSAGVYNVYKDIYFGGILFHRYVDDNQVIVI